MKGKFLILGQEWNNHIMDEGIKKLMRILADVTEQNKLLISMSVGTSDADPDDRTKSALVAEVGQKYSIGSHSVNAVYPFDLELTITIPDNEIPRPETVKEIGVWFGPVGSEFLFARATNSVGVVLPVSTAVPVKYDLNIVD